MVNTTVEKDDNNESESWKKVRILTVNDVYTFDDDVHGGWSRISSLISELRDENTIVTVNGDFLGGASLLQKTQGQIAIDIMNAISIDVVVIGNHEFDYGDDVLKECIQKSNFVWLGSNVYEKNTGELFPGVRDVYSWSPSSSSEMEDDVKFNFFGLCTSATPKLSYPSSNVEFVNIHTTTQRVLAENNSDNNVWVALTHLSMQQDIDLANSKQQKKIKCILGGHDHDPMSMEIHDTLIFKCGQNGYWVGCIDLYISNTDEQIYYSQAMHSTCTVQPDPKIQAIVQSHQQRLEKDDDNVIVANIKSGCFNTQTSHVRRKESTSGNLIADAMLWYYVHNQTDSEKTWCAMINGGFIRGDSMYTQQLLMKNIREELPFPKDICCIQILGKYLHVAFQQQLKPVPSATASFPHVSHNLQLTYSTSTKQLSIRIHDQPIDPEQHYYIIVTDFIANGGDGCTAWVEHGKRIPITIERATIQPKQISLVLLDYLKHHPILQCHLQNRVTITS